MEWKWKWKRAGTTKQAVQQILTSVYEALTAVVIETYIYKSYYRSKMRGLLEHLPDCAKAKSKGWGADEWAQQSGNEQLYTQQRNRNHAY
jgi:hypothetical protein